MVFQNVVLFNNTVMENIRYGRLDATDEEVIAAYIAKKASKEKMGNFDPEELLFVVQAHMDFEEEQGE